MLILRTLGGVVVEHAGAPLEGVPVQPSRLAMLAVLARAGSAGMSRDKLQALLWPEKDAAHARGALRQAVYSVRRALGDVIAGGWTLHLDHGSITTDVGAFASAVESGDLEAAVAWYRGPFLDGFFTGSDPLERWVDREREHLAQMYAAVLERLALRAISAHDAVAWWRRLVELDPFSPRLVIRLMEDLVRDGDRYAAIRCARDHARLILAEFGAPPDAEVAMLAERLERYGRDQPPASRADPRSRKAPLARRR
jgi:DNA-binding SARP family transcriptional activator